MGYAGREKVMPLIEKWWCENMTWLNAIEVYQLKNIRSKSLTATADMN